MYTRTSGLLLMRNSTCRRETSNRFDPFAVAVIKDGTVVGHVPRKLSAICLLFLRHCGVTICQIDGQRRYSRDLPQGGLEVRVYILTFTGDNTYIRILEVRVYIDLYWR